MNPMVDHRGPEFAGMLPTITDNLKTLFLTDNDVLILTASGSGGLEAAVVNVLSPGEKILVVSIGSFGNRFGKIAEIYGAEVIWLKKDWGLPALPSEVAMMLDQNPDISAVVVGIITPGSVKPRAVRRPRDRIEESDKFGVVAI